MYYIKYQSISGDAIQCNFQTMEQLNKVRDEMLSDGRIILNWGELE